jgi:hypothetical protein
MRLPMLKTAVICAVLLGTAGFSTSAFADDDGDNDRVVDADSAVLVAGEDTCMGSSTIGGQGVGFGISIGTTWTDENCQRLKNARELSSLGFNKAAVALVCLDDDVQTAMRAAGTPCPYARGDEARNSRRHEPQRVAELAESHTRTNATPILPKPRRVVTMEPIADEQ